VKLVENLVVSVELVGFYTAVETVQARGVNGRTQTTDENLRRLRVEGGVLLRFELVDQVES
jgi:hypothetical protein